MNELINQSINDLFGQNKEYSTGHAGPRTLTRAKKKKNILYVRTYVCVYVCVCVCVYY